VRTAIDVIAKRRGRRLQFGWPSFLEPAVRSSCPYPLKAAATRRRENSSIKHDRLHAPARLDTRRETSTPGRPGKPRTASATLSGVRAARQASTATGTTIPDRTVQSKGLGIAAGQRAFGGVETSAGRRRRQKAAMPAPRHRRAFATFDGFHQPACRCACLDIAATRFGRFTAVQLQHVEARRSPSRSSSSASSAIDEQADAADRFGYPCAQSPAACVEIDMARARRGIGSRNPTQRAPARPPRHRPSSGGRQGRRSWLRRS